MHDLTMKIREFSVGSSAANFAAAKALLVEQDGNPGGFPLVDERNLQARQGARASHDLRMSMTSDRSTSSTLLSQASLFFQILSTLTLSTLSPLEACL